MDKADTVSLREKYRASWLRASESQRNMLCMRLGLVYTHACDENLLQQVSHLQEQKYLQNKLDKMERQATKDMGSSSSSSSPSSKEINTIGAFALLRKIQQSQQKKVAVIKK